LENPDVVAEGQRTDQGENLKGLEEETSVDEVGTGGKGKDLGTTTDGGEDVENVGKGCSTTKGKAPQGS